MSTDVLMTKVSQVAPKEYAYITKMAGIIAEGPFRDEVVGQLDTIVKKANAMNMAPSMGARFGNAMAGIGIAAGTGIAVSLAGDMFEATKRGVTKTINYRRMMKSNPDLAKLDANEVQRAFSTLHRFNSDFSGDPMVAGAYVRKASQFADDAFNPAQLSNMVSAKKNMHDMSKLPIPGHMPWDPLGSSRGKKEELELKKLEQGMAHNDEKHRLEMQNHPMHAEKAYLDLLKARRGKNLDDAEDMLAASGIHQQR